MSRRSRRSGSGRTVGPVVAPSGSVFPLSRPVDPLVELQELQELDRVVGPYRPTIGRTALLRVPVQRRMLPPRDGRLIHAKRRLDVSFRAPWSVRRIWNVPIQLKLRVPWKVKFCIARKRRREVLFALKRTGKGSPRYGKRVYRSESSNYRC